MYLFIYTIEFNVSTTLNYYAFLNCHSNQEWVKLDSNFCILYVAETSILEIYKIWLSKTWMGYLFSANHRFSIYTTEGWGHRLTIF